MEKELDAPDLLYRGFKVLEHAREFVNDGIISFRRVDHYRDLEDPGRCDQDEGTAEFRTPDIAENWERLNLVYVFCCSAADPAYVASKFGPHVVRINNPKALIGDIGEYISAHLGVPKARVYPTWVRYDRGTAVPKSPGIDEWVELAYSQKSASFAADKEYRIAVVSLLSPQHPVADSTAPSIIFVKLGRRLGYCDLLG
jgi:hypothetical protein